MVQRKLTRNSDIRNITFPPELWIHFWLSRAFAADKVKTHSVEIFNVIILDLYAHVLENLDSLTDYRYSGRKDWNLHMNTTDRNETSVFP